MGHQWDALVDSIEGQNGKIVFHFAGANGQTGQIQILRSFILNPHLWIHPALNVIYSSKLSYVTLSF